MHTIFQLIKTFLQKENIVSPIVPIASPAALAPPSNVVMLPSTNSLLDQETTAFQVSSGTMRPGKHYKRKIIRQQKKQVGDYNWTIFVINLM